MIRPYQESDLSGIIELLNLLKESPEASKFEDVLFDPVSYLETYLVKRTYKTFVSVELSGEATGQATRQVVGFIIGEHYCNDVIGIIMLYVHPNFRRKKQALKLKSALVDHAKENSYKQIVSQVRTNNTESIKMNEKAGWTVSVDKIYPDYYVECKIVLDK